MTTYGEFISFLDPNKGYQMRVGEIVAIAQGIEPHDVAYHVLTDDGELHVLFEAKFNFDALSKAMIEHERTIDSARATKSS